MLHNDRLVAYMKQKQLILREKGGLTLPYFDSEDAEDIRGWDITSAGMVCICIKDTLLEYMIPSPIQELEKRDTGNLMRGVFCPWCWRYHRHGSCDGCSYGTRNGICSDSDSRWCRVMQEISMKCMTVPLTKADLTSLVNCLEDKS